MKSPYNVLPVVNSVLRLISAALLLTLANLFSSFGANAAVIYSEPPDLPGQIYSLGDTPPPPLNIGSLLLGDNVIQGQITLNVGADIKDYLDYWTATVPGNLRVTGAKVTIYALSEFSDFVGGFETYVTNASGFRMEAAGYGAGTYQLTDLFGASSVFWDTPTITGAVKTPPFVWDPLFTVGEDAFGYELAITTSVVPIPAAVWLFSAGLLGLVSIARRRT